MVCIECYLPFLAVLIHTLMGWYNAWRSKAAATKTIEGKKGGEQAAAAEAEAAPATAEPQR